jgi:hypothetical protein
VISLSQGRYLKQTKNNHKQTSTPRAGFEPTIPPFERAKTVHVSDIPANVIGQFIRWRVKILAWKRDTDGNGGTDIDDDDDDYPITNPNTI